jgi:hypothetical protein
MALMMLLLLIMIGGSVQVVFIVALMPRYCPTVALLTDRFIVVMTTTIDGND